MVSDFDPEFDISEKTKQQAKLLRNSSKIADALCRCIEHIEAAEEKERNRIWQEEAFNIVPPFWATWEDCKMYGERCGNCKAWCTIVRPGKTQCDNSNCREG